jgi:hypothetical protein
VTCRAVPEQARRIEAQGYDGVVSRGCMVVRVNSHTFQAPGFYVGLGYEQIGLAMDTPVGHGAVFLQKRLDGSNG